ncbi:11173_t:CDS:10 [Entrophospora sp. SA101]|nr:11173_t:CDS:10 [Entrophospora sp. SA101]
MISKHESDIVKVSILNEESIIIGFHLTELIFQDIIKSIPSSTYVIITDKNIASIYLSDLITNFENIVNKLFSSSPSSPRILTYVIPPGEQSKSRKTKGEIEDYLLSKACTRDACIIALGGGVVGDLVGYVAATFMRGVPFVQVPTTLLAMVDSSIGGKTAIDTPHGKNLIGAFWQPKKIFVDLNFLTTLPEREFINGMAEVIKHAAIWNNNEFEKLENGVKSIHEAVLNPPKDVPFQGNTLETRTPSQSLLLSVILASIKVKAHVVTHDERESGLRGLLNFGHTIGHAIETILAPDLLHGECVSIGMIKEAEISRNLGYLNQVAVGRLSICLQNYGLPVSLDDKKVKQLVGNKYCDVDRLLEIMKIDKKNQGDKKRLVILTAIGKTLEKKATVVSDSIIHKILSPAIRVFPKFSTNNCANSPTSIHITTPGSKSISNRALILAALGEGTCRLRGILYSDDTQVMLSGLRALGGAKFEWEDDGNTLVVIGGGGKLTVPDDEIYLGNAGTASRFLTTVCTLASDQSVTEKKQKTILTGVTRYPNFGMNAYEICWQINLKNIYNNNNFSRGRYLVLRLEMTVNSTSHNYQHTKASYQFIHNIHNNYLKEMNETQETLKFKIKEQGEKIRLLKTQDVDKTLIDTELEVLSDLKNQLSSLAGESSKNKNKHAFTLKTPKGTRDYNEKEMSIRDKIFSTIISTFKKHGAVTIDTPVFELKEILSGKYGEDSKLIFDLEDQGGELCSLRYDLTVPFARFLAINGSQYQNFKRYQIAKVYRRDQPAMTKGRMREFYQCDFDVAGSFDPMIADSEVIKIMCECLTALEIGEYKVKINHRKILDGIFQICGVEESKIRPISSAVDKLDKKALDPIVAEKIGEYVRLKGGRELLDSLLKDEVLISNKNTKSGLDDMILLFKYLEIFNVLDRVSFDLSLARGLDYYTGIIYEAITEQSGPPRLKDNTIVACKTKKGSEELDESTIGVGSIAAGGRYDNLVGMFSSNKKGNIPCVGMSLGVERIFSILLQKIQLDQVKANEVEVYVIAATGGLLEERMKICIELWDAEYMYKNKPKLQSQFTICDRDQIPFAVIIGPDEINNGEVKIKDMRSKEQGVGGGVPIRRSEMIKELKQRLEKKS